LRARCDTFSVLAQTSRRCATTNFPPFTNASSRWPKPSACAYGCCLGHEWVPFPSSLQSRLSDKEASSRLPMQQRAPGRRYSGRWRALGNSNAEMDKCRKINLQSDALSHSWFSRLKEGRKHPPTNARPSPTRYPRSRKEKKSPYETSSNLHL
jgi:hypothetical protein